MYIEYNETTNPEIQTKVSFCKIKNKIKNKITNKNKTRKY